MANDTALVETIAHWQRMVEWVKTQNLEAIPDREVMEQAIGENWTGKYCALCQAQKDSCEECILYWAQNEYSCGNEGTFWKGAAYSASWAEWLQYAKQLLILLKRLEKREKNNEED